MSEQEKDPKNAEPQVETAEEQQAAQAEAANAEAEAPAPEQPSAEEQLAEVEAELAKVKKPWVRRISVPRRKSRMCASAPSGMCSTPTSSPWRNLPAIC